VLLIQGFAGGIDEFVGAEIPDLREFPGCGKRVGVGYGDRPIPTTLDVFPHDFTQRLSGFPSRWVL
jgi:hypothetical protein